MKAFYLPSGLTADEVANGFRAEDSYTRDSDIFILARKFLEVQKELEAIKSQETHCYLTGTTAWFRLSDAEHRAKASRCVTGQDCPVIPLYSRPVYLHSFAVDGHTFYADNEADILYLERKFGVGGKAKLEVVEDE